MIEEGQIVKIVRRAGATWEGSVSSGGGLMRLGREGTEIPFTLKSRTADSGGSNPEELLGAAHAGCFSMALSSLIEEAGHSPERIATDSKVTMEEVDGSFTITAFELRVSGSADGASPAALVSLAEKAKETCPVSRLFSGAQVTLVTDFS